MSQGRFDGITVDQFRARFAGTFDVDDYDAMHQSIDGEVMFIVVARVKGATITEANNGDIVRTNSLKIEQVKSVRQQADREQIADTFGLDLPLQLPITTSATPKDATPASAPATPIAQAAPTPVLDVPELADGDKISVGGAARNDDVLAKFLAV